MMVDRRNDVPESPDYELRAAPDNPPEPSPPRWTLGLWLVVAGLIVATAIAAYIVFGGRLTPGPATSKPERVEAPQRPLPPLGGDAAPIVLPPLDQTDPVVRELVKQVTSHPRAAAWLATDGLIRNFTVVVTNIAEGNTPAKLLQVLRPSSGFRTIEQSGDLYVDPRSYERYDGLAAAAASIEPAAATRLYATLKPRIEEAYRELGVPGASFDRTLERAIVVLLRTPVLNGSIRVEPRGIGYGFADRNLEELTAAQKQLLRTGPANVRIIQSSLRAIALALGIAAERLPGPKT